jgi:oligopeptide/dipeptide ABC transporter ATP-binding protein
MQSLLEVRGLTTSFFTPAGEARGVNGISFDVRRGEILGVVGESGSGKTLTALSVMRLIDPPGRITGGSVLFEGEDLLGKSERCMRAIRGRRIAMIWQDPMASLNPVKRIGDQVAEALHLHGDVISGKSDCRRAFPQRELKGRVVSLLGAVNVPDPEQRAQEYPHQLSGGLQQRVMIAMALACEPSLLIADEPTTALDVTIQLQILELLKRIQRERDMSVMLITHDLGVVAETCHRVQVMYAGQIIESADVVDLFDEPKHPYTTSLLRSVPRHDTRRGDLAAIEGRVPDLTAMPPGCPFHPRCDHAMDICGTQEPRSFDLRGGHAVKCHLYA